MITKRELISIVLAAFCFTSLIFMTISSSGIGEYDPWADINDDGKIDIKDIAYVARLFGAEGVPINKTALYSIRPGKVLIASADAERSTGSGDWALMKRIKVFGTGTFRVCWEMYAYYGAYMGYYITSKITTNNLDADWEFVAYYHGGYTARECHVFASYGDTIELWLRALVPGNGGFIRNFRVYADQPVSTEVIVD